MAFLPETESFDAGVYEIATTDPVIGGDETAIANKQAEALANRTKYLKSHVDDLEADVLALQTALAAPATTEGAGDDDTSLATTAFVHRAAGGFIVVNCAGAGNIALTSDQWGCAIIVMIGARTANGNVVFPTRANGDRWLTVNRTTGNFAMTCKTAAGGGVKVAQGRSKDIWCDGTDILDAETDLSIRPRIITAATTLAPGDDVIANQSGGTFALTMPAAPADGDQVRIRGNFGTSNMTVLRNGHKFYDKTGAAVAADLVIDRNNASDVCTFVAADDAWLVTQG